MMISVLGVLSRAWISGAASFAAGLCSLDQVALPSLLAMGCTVRIRSVHTGEYLACARPSLALTAAEPAPFWLQAVESDASKLIERLTSPAAVHDSRIACHLCPVQGAAGGVREYVSLQQEQPTTTSSIAASLVVVPVKDEPFLRFEGFGGGGQRAMAVGGAGMLEMQTPEEGGNLLQKMVRVLKGTGRRMAFVIEVLESSLAGEGKSLLHTASWLPLGDACLRTLQLGLGVSLTIVPRGVRSEADTFVLTSQGVLRKGKEGGGRGEVSDFGIFKVKKVTFETSASSGSQGLLVAELAATPKGGGRSGEKEDAGKGKAASSSGGGERGDGLMRRYVVVDDGALESRDVVRLVKNAPSQVDLLKHQLLSSLRSGPARCVLCS